MRDKLFCGLVHTNVTEIGLSCVLGALLTSESDAETGFSQQIHVYSICTDHPILFG